MQNESYFYEVFNITNYGTPEEEYLFWLDGTGVIDDVDFPIGLYLIKKYIGGEVIEYKINVMGGGILRLLTVELKYYDDFSGEGSTTTDGIVWKEKTSNKKAV